MLRIEDITYSIAGRRVFESASAVIPRGHCVGVVGRNGSGKTTLFRLVRGEATLESGRIVLPASARIGVVEQEVPASAVSVIDTVLAKDGERDALLAAAETEEDPGRIAEIQTRLADIDAWSAEARAASILRGLGFSQADQGRPCSDYSGGWRMRIALAGVLFSAPDLLLLDEPTNYLDLEGAIWLESFLADYAYTTLVISHDKGILNRSVGSILLVEDGKLSLYRGSFDVFAERRAAQRQLAVSDAKKQAARRAHLQRYVDRFRYKASKAKQAQSRLKMLSRMATSDIAPDRASSRFEFGTPEALAPPIIAIEDACIGYGATTVLKRLSLRIDSDDRIALLGKNGEGKSTLAKFLAGHLPPQRGHLTRSPKLRVGYFAQHQLEALEADQTPLAHLARVQPDEPPKHWRARLAAYGLGSDLVETRARQLSGGQRARLALLLATVHNPHLLILDEPTNHLDLDSRNALIAALAGFEGAAVVVSHDFHFLNHVADQLWLVGEGRVRSFDGDLDAYRSLVLDTGEMQGRPRPAPSRPAPPGVDLGALRRDVRAAETRVMKIEDMRERLARKLAEPRAYETDKLAETQRLQAQYAEIEDALERAEALWIRAQDRLDAATA